MNDCSHFSRSLKEGPPSVAFGLESLHGDYMRPKTSGSHRNPVDTSFRDAALSISGRSKDTTFQVQGVSYDLQFVLLSISIANIPERCFQGLAIVTTIVLKRYIDGA